MSRHVIHRGAARQVQSHPKLVATFVTTGVMCALMFVGVAPGFSAPVSLAPFQHAQTPSPKAAASGCSPSPTPTLTGAGSTLVYPLMSQWVSVYAGGAAVNYLSVGSGAGITDIIAKTVDFGATDAPLNAAQRAAAPGLLTVPESAGGVVPIYNVPGAPILNFTGAVLAGIYLGTITNWNSSELRALNPGVHLPNASIGVVYRSDGSGTTFIWTSYLSLENATWASIVGKGTAVPFPIGTGEPKEAGLGSYVQSTPYTIGYIDLSYALTAGIQFGRVQNPAGHFLLATVNDTASALKDANPTLPAGNGDWYNVSVLNAPGTDDYPITSLTYVLVYANLSAAYPSYTLGKAENLANFLWWMVTVGQNYSAPLYFVPLPQSIVLPDEATIETMTFNGSPIPICGATHEMYAVTFDESGLASGTNWSVTISGVSESSTTDRVTFQLPNGTVTYSIPPVRGYAVNHSSGSVDVQGTPRTLFVGFTVYPVYYTLAFSETGLASGTNWSVTIGTTTRNSTNSSITFRETNGTYSYQVGAVTGYTVSPSSGPLTLAGTPIQTGLVFTSTGGTSHGSNSVLSTTDYAIFAGIAIVVAILLAVLLTRRKRGSPPNSQEDGGESSPHNSP
ncbi:MAG: phosphate ABC transporter substrate-binding protein PstS [Thermoplasmata archaeon]